VYILYNLSAALPPAQGAYCGLGGWVSEVVCGGGGGVWGGVGRGGEWGRAGGL